MRPTMKELLTVQLDLALDDVDRALLHVNDTRAQLVKEESRLRIAQASADSIKTELDSFS